MPRFAILGDIHANFEALETVLKAVEAESVDYVYSVGDIVGYGASPAECVERLRERRIEWVAGNHDHAVCGLLSLEYFNPFAKEAAEWTAEQLSEEQIEALKGATLLTTLNGVTIVHSTVHAPELFGYIDTLYAAYLCFEAMETRVGFVGHSHIPVTFLQNAEDLTPSYTLEREVDLSKWGKALINVGSIGQPRDEDPRAAYCIYDSDAEQVWIKRVEYDVEGSAQKIIDAGLPRILAERLFVGR